MQKRLLILGLIVWLLPTLACSLLNFGGDDEEAAESASSEVSLGAEATATPTPAPVESQPVEPTPTPTTPPPATPTEAAPEQPAESSDENGDGDSFTFAGVTDLENLSSYRVSFLMNFDGTSGGQPAKGQIEMMLESTKNPVARHLAMSMAGSPVEELGGANKLEFYQVEDTVYMYNNASGDEWISMSGGDSSAFTEGFFTPQEELDVPETADCSDDVEVVNGINTNHCTFIESDIATTDTSFSTAQGDVWIAVDEKFIVKFKVVGEINEGTGQENEMLDSGSMAYEYNLQNINEDFTITVPEEAKNAESLDFGLGNDPATGGEASELPMPDNAEEVFSVAGITSFFAPSTVEEIIQFYRQELAALGWTEDDSQAFTSDQTAFLSFNKDGGSLTLTVNLEADGRAQVTLIPTEP